MSLWEHLKAKGIKDITDFKKVQAFFEWEDIKKNGLHLSAEEILSFSEQIVYRTRVCRECVEDGKCRDCKCPMPEKALTPKATCSEGKWPAMLSPEKWEEYKEEKQIKFLVI